jgi:hypothetical protein
LLVHILGQLCDSLGLSFDDRVVIALGLLPFPNHSCKLLYLVSIGVDDVPQLLNDLDVPVGLFLYVVFLLFLFKLCTFGQHPAGSLRRGLFLVVDIDGRLVLEPKHVLKVIYLIIQLQPFFLVKSH